jgi:hypothetical protein
MLTNTHRLITLHNRSAVIIDRAEGEEGGLYKRLFVALYVVLSNVLRTTHGYPDQYQLKFMSPVIHRALLAAEVCFLQITFFSTCYQLCISLGVTW